MDTQNNQYDSLKDIFKDLKNILEKISKYGFWRRLFAWALLKDDAKKLDSKLETIQDIIGDIRIKFKDLDDLDNVKSENEALKKKVTTFENTIESETKKLTDAQNKYHIMITSHGDRIE